MNIWTPCIPLITIHSTASTLVPNRTGSLSLRRRTLYPIELRGQFIHVSKLGEIKVIILFFILNYFFDQTLSRFSPIVLRLDI